MRHVLTALALAAAFGARAQEVFPTRVLRFVVPLSAGSSPDILARGFAEAMTNELGQTILVVNKEGASGAIGDAFVAASAADGYTLGYGPQGPITVVPHAKAGSSYDLASFQPLCQLYEDTFALFVGPNSPIKDLPDLIARAKANPKSLSFGSPGIATVPHLQVESLMASAGISMKHAPYRLVGQMTQDTLGGNTDLSVGSVASIRGSNARVLAILGEQRSPVFPDAPIPSEFGHRISKTSFIGLYAPKATPADVVSTLEAACVKAEASPAYRKLEADSGARPAFLPRAAYAARLAEDDKEKSALIKTLGVSIE
jgi:tripartite-type tricarboxylate transporter receptor subunit TctC